MFSSILNDVKKEFQFGNRVTQLIVINIAVALIFLVLRVAFNGSAIDGGSSFYKDILHLFTISSDWLHNLTHPWVFFTSNFIHEGIWHLLWNMLFLYWFGRIVGDLVGDGKILALYIYGGIVGCTAFFLASNVLPIFSGRGISYALGASASVMAIVMAAGVLAPDYNLRLLIIGDVKLKYVVGFLILLDLFGVGADANTGGHVAHLGGVAFGWYFVTALRSGNDLSIKFNKVFEYLTNIFTVSKSKSEESKSKKDQIPRSQQEEIDAILDKIKDHGYESLTKEEKEFLFNASKN